MVVMFKQVLSRQGKSAEQEIATSGKALLAMTNRHSERSVGVSSAKATSSNEMPTSRLTPLLGMTNRHSERIIASASNFIARSDSDLAISLENSIQRHCEERQRRGNLTTETKIDINNLV